MDRLGALLLLWLLWLWLLFCVCVCGGLVCYPLLAQKMGDGSSPDFEPQAPDSFLFRALPPLFKVNGWIWQVT